jgi:cytochrome c oxidase cbb3-type subunit 3
MKTIYAHARCIAPALVVAATALAGCYREERPLPTPPSAAAATGNLRQSEIRPGKPEPKTVLKNPYEENAYAVSQGQKLFKQYNCNGCHSQGGGGMGPALMDDKWIYGHEPENIFATITQGRPNGMPAFGGRIPDDQVWQLAAYVRSLSGQLARSVTSARSDSLQGKQPAVRDKEQPMPTGPGKSSEQ